MDFEELRMAWTSQDDQAALAIDPKALHASVQRKAAQMGNQAAWMEVGCIGCGLSLAAIFLLDLVVHTWVFPDQGEVYQKAMSALLAVICLGVAAYGFRSRLRRKAGRATIGRSMLDQVRRAHEHVERCVNHSNHLIVYYMLPLAVLAIINLAFFSAQVTPWVWAATLVLCVVGVWETRRDIRERLDPERRNLVYLRDELLADEPR